MPELWIILGAVAFLAVALLVTTYVCFYITFYVPDKKRVNFADFSTLGKEFEPYIEQMKQWTKEVELIPYRQFEIKSFDGLSLYAKYYEYKKGAPIEIMFHGYRGNAKRDLCGGVQRCFKLERNVLLVDQRASGLSQGRVITFGVNEMRDCVDWVNFAVKQFGKDVKIIMTGISMGASSVLMASSQPLPGNVVSVIADCGFTSAKDIIKKCIADMKLPPALVYPLIKLGARIFGRFKLEDTPAIESVKSCKIPVVFFHGEDDAYVPHYMSKQNHDACTSPKILVSMPKTGHGMSYLIHPERYLSNLREFEAKYVWKNKE